MREKVLALLRQTGKLTEAEVNSLAVAIAEMHEDELNLVMSDREEVVKDTPTLSKMPNFNAGSPVIGRNAAV